MPQKRTVIGLSEEVVILNGKTKKKILARIDSGATRSSVDAKIAAELKLGPIEKTALVKNAIGTERRPIIRVEIKIQNRDMESLFTVSDRASMKYQMLIGQDILKKGFIIDPLKNTLLQKK